MLPVTVYNITDVIVRFASTKKEKETAMAILILMVTLKRGIQKN
jgi:hypothetical protein